MGGQLDGIFLAGSMPHEFIILIVTLFICLWLINFFFSLSLFTNSHRAQLGVHKVLYHPHRATWNVAYERSVIALCAHI